jgi:hypothetical protein
MWGFVFFERRITMTSENTDLGKITQTVQYYFDGMYHSDTEALKKAFDPDAYLHGYFEGQLVHLPFNAWLKQVENRPAPSNSDEAYDMKIVSVDITENIAQVKVFDLYMGKYFTDYLSLIKVEENWAIMNKMFYHQ